MNLVSRKKDLNRNECGDRGCLLALFKNLTFEEWVAENNCSINSDEGEGLLFA